MILAVLITCHNRKEKTLACLSSLFAVLPECAVYLVDDASTDGTSDAVKENFPQVNMIHGDGNLFWNRGMYTAWREAIKGKYDYFLLLNDDIKLFTFFYEELIECMNLCGNHCVVVGSVADKETKKVIYGGTDELLLKYEQTQQIQQTHRMNCNVCLIPVSVVKNIGIFDPKYWHDLGDYDYRMRVEKAGIKIYTTRRVVALGYSNNYCRVRKWNSNIVVRMKRLYSPLGAPPYISFYFKRKYYGLFRAVGYWFFLHLINVLPDKIVAILWGDKYKYT